MIANVIEFLEPDELAPPPVFSWHEVLGVAPDCNLQTAAAARSRLAKQYHPDLGGSTGAMQRINAAFEAAKARD